MHKERIWPNAEARKQRRDAAIKRRADEGAAREWEVDAMIRQNIEEHGA